MLVAELAVTLFIGMVLAALFVFAFGWGRSDTDQAWPALLFFFLIVWMGAWALGAWVTPFGPLFWGVPVLTFFFIALLFALVLAAAVPAGPRRPYPAAGPPRVDEEASAALGFGVFFWVLLLALLVALVARYV